MKAGPVTILLLALAASAALLFSQTPTTIRTETRVVQIHVAVRDSHGQPVAGLSKDDFTVTDAGKRRALQIFSVEGSAEPATVEPAVQAALPALPPNVFSNRSQPASRPAHATVILLDAINNYWDDFAASRLRLLKMIDKLSKDERIAVYAATTKPAGIVVIQDFTTDRARMRRAIQTYVPPPLEAAPGLGPPPPPVQAEMERRVATLDTRRIAMRDMMSAFRLLSEHLGKLPGRKSLLWLTSGLPPKELREMQDPYEKATSALNEANIAVNVLDDDGVGDPYGRSNRRWGRAASSTLQNLADDTGGKAYLRRNDLENMLVEAIEAPRITYTLGFYLPDDERDDRFHPLVVKANRPKLTLSYRKGYLAGALPQPTAPKKREPMENALLDPMDSAEIGITAEVTAVPGTPRAALRVSLKLGLAQLRLRRQADEWSGEVQEMFLETNAAGAVVAKFNASKTLQMSQRMRERFESEGVPLVHEIALVEGATRLLIVVRDVESGRTGTLSVPLLGIAPPLSPSR